MSGRPPGRGRRPPAGQGFVEFGLILALGVLIALVIILFLSPQLAWVLSLIGTEIDQAH